MTDPVTITPEWLAPPSSTHPLTSTEIDTILADAPQTIRKAREYNFGIIFERILLDIEKGMTLTAVIRNTTEREPDVHYHEFRSWIFRNPKRLERFREAQVIGASYIEDEMIEIADAKDAPLEDVQRSKLRIDTRFKILAIQDRKRYGEKTENINTGNGAVNIFIEGVVSPYAKDVTTAPITIEQEAVDG